MFRYFLENFKFLLSYPGRGAFYIFCGSLALANTGMCSCLFTWSRRCPSWLLCRKRFYRLVVTAHFRKIVFHLPVRPVTLQCIARGKSYPRPLLRRYITGAILCTNGVGNFVASWKCVPPPFFFYLVAFALIPAACCWYGVTDQNSNTRYSAVPTVRALTLLIFRAAYAISG